MSKKLLRNLLVLMNVHHILFVFYMNKNKCMRLLFVWRAITHFSFAKITIKDSSCGLSNCIYTYLRGLHKVKENEKANSVCGYTSHLAKLKFKLYKVEPGNFPEYVNVNFDKSLIISSMLLAS